MLQKIKTDQIVQEGDPDYPPRILLLYGSLRERSYSRLLSEEASRILQLLGAETKIFSPRNLPAIDTDDGSHSKIRELRELAIWSDGMVWVSPEHHGAVSSILKSQIDWLPFALSGAHSTQGKTLALCQISGGFQSFNTLNQMRIVGRWMRMIVIPNQSSIPQVSSEFDDKGRMYPSKYYNRIVDVMEELVKYTWLIRGRSAYLLDSYSDRLAKKGKMSLQTN